MRLLEKQFDTAVAIKNILFATDFSEISEAALPYVTALSLRYGSTIHVAHVLPEVTFLRPGAPDPAVIGSIYEDAHSLAQEKIQRLSDRLSGFPHHTYVRHGGVLEVIDELAREQEVDLIVLGTHGRTGLGKLVLGSIAEGIFRHASCPVLTVGPRVPSLAATIRARHDRDLPPTRQRSRPHRNEIRSRPSRRRRRRQIDERTPRAGRYPPSPQFRMRLLLSVARRHLRPRQLQVR